MPNEKKPSVVYIDGFNLYFGAVRSTPWKWLDLQAYFERLRPDDDIQAIKYFTATVQNDREANNRQQAYLMALETLPKVEIIYGKFKPKQATCGVDRCGLQGSKKYTMPEEKQTDVAIGVHMLDDAYQGLCERLVVVSGDSDLLPALKMVKHRFPQKSISVYVPARNPMRGAAVEVRRTADKHLTLPNKLIEQHQLPDPLIADRLAIAKPVGW